MTMMFLKFLYSVIALSTERFSEIENVGDLEVSWDERGQALLGVELECLNAVVLAASLEQY